MEQCVIAFRREREKNRMEKIDREIEVHIRRERESTRENQRDGEREESTIMIP